MSDAPASSASPQPDARPTARDGIDPAHWEFCDGADNDGDGLIDETECPEEYLCLRTESCVCADGYDRCGDGCVALAVPHGPCGGRCALFHNDTRNCGACEHACDEGASCVMGRCVCHATACEGHCVDITSNVSNCGACGHACGANERCVDSRCVCIDTCDGHCTNLMVDPAHCGTCGHACGPEQFCASGQCGCLDRRLTACGVECRPLGTSTDCQHCGMRCRAHQVCRSVDGFDQCACPFGTNECDNQCLTYSGPDHCGSCENVCAPGFGCDGHYCVCRPPGMACDGVCVDTHTSTAHCGGCNRPCADGLRCVEGACVD